MRSAPELRRMLHVDYLEEERPEDRARCERLERQEERHRRAAAHRRAPLVSVLDVVVLAFVLAPAAAGL